MPSPTRRSPSQEIEALPLATEAEECTLGSMLISRKAIEAVSGMLASSDFHWGPHRTLYAAILALHAKGEPVDVVTLAEDLKKAGLLETVGGVPYLLKLENNTPTAAHAEAYARRVLRAANLRRLIHTSYEITDLARTADDDEAALTKAEELIRPLRERAAQAQGPQIVTARDLQQKVLPPVRYIVAGSLPQGLVLLHSRPKTGKTRLADSLSVAVATGGRFLGQIPVERAGVLCLYLEDTEQSAQERLNHALGEWQAPEEFDYCFDWRKLDEGGYRDLDLYLAQHPACKLVIIDTLEMIRPARKDAGGNVYAEDVLVLRAMKQLADKHNICLLVIHHARKGSDQDDLVDAASGTAGITGSTDTIIRLRRPPGSENAVLEGRGRRVRDFEWALRLDEHAGWQFVGEAEEVLQSSQDREVLDALADSPMRPQELADVLEIRRGAAQQRLRRMAMRNLVVNRAGWYSPAAPKEGRETNISGVSGVSAVSPVSCNPVSANGTTLHSNGASVPALAEEAPHTPLTAHTGHTAETQLTPLTEDTPPTPLTTDEGESFTF